jgi:glyoxylase-like metal-dependent hydrolase (beta-lactamase superfamily II)
MPFGGGNRAAFLRRMVMAATAAASISTFGSERNVGAAPSQGWKGRKDSKVKRWDVITIGNLSRNRYWGESNDTAVRSAICTCAVIQGEGFRLIVDPSLSDVGQMTSELDRRTGLKQHDITAVFVTHEHADHWFGIAHFPQARWLAAPEVASALNKTGNMPREVEGTTGVIFEAIQILPTPGHTVSHHSLRFDCDGLSVVIAGDAVATRDFWHERRGYYNCVDFELSAKSMDKIAGVADMVVPGHDNYFLNKK